MFRCPYPAPRSVDVEMTAYGLLIFAARNEFTDAIPVAKWLVSKRNVLGGYTSTQVSLFFSFVVHHKVSGSYISKTD